MIVALVKYFEDTVGVNADIHECCFLTFLDSKKIFFSNVQNFMQVCSECCHECRNDIRECFLTFLDPKIFFPQMFRTSCRFVQNVVTNVGMTFANVIFTFYLPF